MKRIGVLGVSCIMLLAPGGDAASQVAGSTTLGVSVEEVKAVAIGWSAKRQILGKAVYNEKKEQVGRIDDIIVTPERAVSYVIVGAGGVRRSRQTRCRDSDQPVAGAGREVRTIWRDQGSHQGLAEVRIRKEV